MSQFLIAISKDKPITSVSNVTFLPVSEAQEVFTQAGEFYGLELSECWAVLDENKASSELIFTDSAIDLAQADPLSKTDLGKLLGELIYSGSGLMSWYGCEFDDLDDFTSVIDLTEEINRSLPNGSGELYFTYIAR
jgi:hypothetical protein